MKTVIDELIANLKRIKPETMYARSVSKEALDEAGNLNREQLNNSTLSDGSQIGGYSKKTEGYNNIRKTKVSAGDPITFKDTGAFHKSIRASITKNGDLKLSSRSKKAEILQDYVDKNSVNSGGQVLGLTEENLKDWYNVFVHDQFQKNLLDRILYGQ